MSLIEHRSGGAAARVAVVTTSDSRTPETDESGRVLEEVLARGGHTVGHREIVPNRGVVVRAAVENLLGKIGLDAIIVLGGTGVSPRDTSIESVRPLFEKELAGFGELFRRFSFEQVGTAAMLSRATAGIARGKVLVVLPGSPSAVRLAAEKLLLPELGHIIGELRKG